jgi:MoxR-like ATPase
MMQTLTAEEAARARDAVRRLIAQIERVIVGKHDTVEMVVIALLARGHVLIEDIPGVGKTTLAKALARAAGGSFRRIQFTPDLLPGDVTGLTIYNQKTDEFSFHPGPVFTNILLADEINRATPKTQSALLEAMEEAQVTLEGETRALPSPFFVIATQNPVEYRGTYPLPEAQMDRFLMRVRLGYPQRIEEIEMLDRHAAAITSEENQHLPNQSAALLERVQPALSAAEVSRLQHERTRVHVAPPVREYIVDLAHATRGHVQVALGASPRAGLALQRAAQAHALVDGREYVTPDDVKALAPAVLPHRIIVRGEGGLNGQGATSAEKLIRRLLDEVPVPSLP